MGMESKWNGRNEGWKRMELIGKSVWLGGI